MLTLPLLLSLLPLSHTYTHPPPTLTRMASSAAQTPSSSSLASTRTALSRSCSRTNPS
jgi:hypothetical protein